MFWDNLLGTTWADKAEAEKRYKRVRALTEKKSVPKGEQPVIDRGTERAVAEGGEKNMKVE